MSDGDRRKSLAAVICAAFGIGVAFGIGYPLTSLTLESWGEPNWVIGLAGAAPAIAILMAMPFLPAVVRRLGASTAIATGCIIGGLGFLALFVMPNAASWIIMRVIMSAGLVAPWLVGETWINLVTHPGSRGRVIALYAIAFFSGFAAGPLLLSAVGIDGVWPFLIGGAATFAAGVPIILARRLAPVVSQGPHRGAVATMRLAPMAMVAAFAAGFTETSYLSLIANVGLAADLAEARALHLLSLITLGGIVLQFPVGWLSDRVQRPMLMTVLSVLFIVLSLALPIAFAHGMWAEAVVFALGGVILGFYTLGLAMMGERVGRDDLTAANAAFIIVYQIGSIVGPVLCGAAMTVSAIFGFVATVSGLMLMSAACMVMLAGFSAQETGSTPSRDEG